MDKHTGLVSKRDGTPLFSAYCNCDRCRTISAIRSLPNDELLTLRNDAKLGANLRKFFASSDRAIICHRHPPDEIYVGQAHAGCGHYVRDNLDDALAAAVDPDVICDPYDAEYYPNRPEASVSG